MRFSTGTPACACCQFVTYKSQCPVVFDTDLNKPEPEISQEHIRNGTVYSSDDTLDGFHMFWKHQRFIILATQGYDFFIHHGLILTWTPTSLDTISNDIFTMEIAAEEMGELPETDLGSASSTFSVFYKDWETQSLVSESSSASQSGAEEMDLEVDSELDSGLESELSSEESSGSETSEMAVGTPIPVTPQFLDLFAKLHMAEEDKYRIGSELKESLERVLKFQRELEEFKAQVARRKEEQEVARAEAEAEAEALSVETLEPELEFCFLPLAPVTCSPFCPVVRLASVFSHPIANVTALEVLQATPYFQWYDSGL